jgi:hypothetical protein
VLLLVAILLGAGAGLLRPAAGARCPRPGLARLWLLAIAGGLHLASATLVSGDVATVALGASLVALAAFAAANLHVTGVAVVGVGVVVNLVALVVNDGIPVRPESLVQAEIVTAAELATTEVEPPRHLERSTDRLPGLGDVIPVPAARTVVSFGDLIVLVGAADAVRDLARRRRRRWTENERRAYRARTIQANDVQDWGRAPSPSPVSGAQCSAQPDRTAPATRLPARAVAVDDAPDLVAASHSR